MTMTNPIHSRPLQGVAIALTVACGVAIAATTGNESANMASEGTETSALPSGAPISDALLAVDDDVLLYNEHLTTLASPYMMGRVPGSVGMDRARDYCAFTFEQLGIEPAFPSEDGTPFASYYDPFALGGTWQVIEESITIDGFDGLEPGEDFVYTGLGSDGEVRGDLVFVGYSIDNGPNGYNSFAGLDDLEGKIAVLFRFEPVDEQGEAQWGNGSWSGRASFRNKLRGIAERGAAGAIIINPPGTFDDRANRLSRFGSGGGAEFPVFMMSTDAGQNLVEAADFDGLDLMALRQHADRGGSPIAGQERIALVGQGERETIEAANVGGVIRGTGDLADEWIVVGAHLDHLGMGYFGSRTGPGALHPGADDNASGSAAVLVLADKLASMRDQTDGDRRSILLLLFDGEESGLNGARHYVTDPIADASNHVLMMNWDMIGRIEEERIVVAGLNTAEGMRDFFTPFFADSGLNVRAPERMTGASDHMVFYRAGIPVIFSHIDGLHSDYHTPADTSDKINRLGATKAVRLYTEMIEAYASHKTRFEFATPEPQRSAAPVANIRVRFGIMPGTYSEDEDGIPVGGLTPGGAAEKAGVLAGDRVVRWDGQKIGDVESWMEMLAKHEPGDEVKVGVLRDGEELTLDVTLQAP